MDVSNQENRNDSLLHERDDAAPPTDDLENLLPIIRYIGLLRLWRKTCVFFMCYYFPTTLAMAIVLAVEWSSICDKPLKEWVLGQIILQVLMFGLTVFTYLHLPGTEDDAATQEQKIRSVRVYYVTNRLLNFVWFWWFVLGAAWTFSADDCSSSAPSLFRLCLGMTVIHFVVLFGVFLVIMCACMGIVVSVHLQEYEAPPPGASKSMIRSLPSTKYKDDIPGIHKEDAMCGICLCQYEVDEDLRLLPCKHHFHCECVDKWLRKNRSCPFCKHQIDKPYNGKPYVVVQQSQEDAVGDEHVENRENNSENLHSEEAPGGTDDANIELSSNNIEYPVQEDRSSSEQSSSEKNTEAEPESELQSNGALHNDPGDKDEEDYYRTTDMSLNIDTDSDSREERDAITKTLLV